MKFVSTSDPVMSARGSQLLFVLCLILPVLAFISCKRSQPTAEEMRALIIGHLHVGSTKTEVVEFLESKKIRHSDIQDFFELDEKQNRVPTRIMTASIPQNTFWTKSEVLMIFNFDRSDRLTKYEVKDVNTGL